MKFYKPQLQLAYQIIQDDQEMFQKQYTLHAVTFCRFTNFRADGHSISNENVTAGKLNVTLRLKEDPDLPVFEYITPVVHTISLGAMPFGEEAGIIEVEVEGIVLEEAAATSKSGNNDGAAASGTSTQTSTKTGGKSAVSTSDADDKSRPILAGRLV